MSQKGLYINPTTFIPLNQISENLTTEIATRNFAMGGYSGFFNYLPDPDPILRKLGMDQTAYKDLLADEQVGSLFNRRKNLTKSQDWYIEQNDAGDKEMELCELTIETLEGFGCKVKDLISQSLNPTGFGYSVFEISKFAYIKGNWIPAVVWEKPREWFHFDDLNRLRFRTNGNFDGILLNGEGSEPKIAAKFILLQNDPSYENPYGDKVLSRCFWPVTFKRGGTKLYGDFIERFGLPFIYGKLPRTATTEQHSDLFNQLVNFISGAIGTGPDDSSVQIIETKGTASADVFDRYLQRCDNAISKAILLNALSTDIQSSGARASSETGATTIEGDIGQSDQDLPTTLFNQIFKRIVDMNIGSGKYPTWAFKQLDDSKKDFATRDKTLSDAAQASGQRIKRKKTYFINNYGYKDDEFELVDDEPAQKVNNVLPNTQPIKLPITDTLPVELSNRSLWKKFTELFTSKFELALPAGRFAAKKKFADELADQLPDKLLQFAIEETLKPVFELAKQSNSRDEFLNSLASVYPNMNTDEIQQLAAKVIFISELEGRLKN